MQGFVSVCQCVSQYVLVTNLVRAPCHYIPPLLSLLPLLPRTLDHLNQWVAPDYSSRTRAGLVSRNIVIHQLNSDRGMNFKEEIKIGFYELRRSVLAPNSLSQPGSKHGENRSALKVV